MPDHFGTVDEDMHSIAIHSLSYKGRIWNPILAALEDGSTANAFETKIKQYQRQADNCFYWTLLDCLALHDFWWWSCQARRYVRVGEESLATLQDWNNRLRRATRHSADKATHRNPDEKRHIVEKSNVERLTAFYQMYDPGKVDQAARFAEKYRGKEKQMWVVLTKKYGPEPNGAE